MTKSLLEPILESEKFDFVSCIIITCLFLLGLFLGFIGGRQSVEDDSYKCNSIKVERLLESAGGDIERARAMIRKCGYENENKSVRK